MAACSACSRIIVIANLAAKYHDPVAVGIGSVLALWSVVALAIVGGRGLQRIRILQIVGGDSVPSRRGFRHVTQLSRRITPKEVAAAAQNPAASACSRTWVPVTEVADRYGVNA